MTRNQLLSDQFVRQYVKSAQALFHKGVLGCEKSVVVEFNAGE